MFFLILDVLHKKKEDNSLLVECLAIAECPSFTLLGYILLSKEGFNSTHDAFGLASLKSVLFQL